MNRTQLEHIIRAASAIAGDNEVIVIGSQAIHAQVPSPPPEALMSMEADVYPRNYPERAELIDGAIGELSSFHQTFGYYAQGVSPETATLPVGWQDRLVILKSENTGTGVGLCLSLHDLVLAKYVANREKDRAFNRAVIAAGLVEHHSLLELLERMPVPDAERERVRELVDLGFKQTR